MEDLSWVPTSVGGTMAGRNPIHLILDEARRKPFIKDIIDRLPEMTDDEFDALQMPLLWQKKALTELRVYKARQDAQIAAQSFVEDMGDIKDETASTGFIVRHTGPDTYWSPPKRNNRYMTPLDILIKTGDLMFVTETETWIASMSVGFPNLPCEIIERDVTRQRYFERMDRVSPAQRDGLANNESRQHGNRGFTIFRPQS